MKRIIFKIWIAIKEISFAIGIISSIISILIFLGIQDIKNMLNNPRDNLDLRLDEKTISLVSKKIAIINGKISINKNYKSVNSFLRKTNTDIFLISKSLNTNSKWIVQAHPIIQDNGDLSIAIDLSCNPTIDSINSIQTMLISCHNNSIYEGFEFRDLLPFFDKVSNPVIIKTH
jgi:hypothetical protein